MVVFGAGRLPPPPSDSSSASPVSDPEDFSRPRHKKKSLKGSNSRSRHHPQTAAPPGPAVKPKAIFAQIPTVPKGFVPYQLSGDSGVFSGLSGSRNKSLTMDEGSGLLLLPINYYILHSTLLALRKDKIIAF